MSPTGPKNREKSGGMAETDVRVGFLILVRVLGGQVGEQQPQEFDGLHQGEVDG